MNERELFLAALDIDDPAERQAHVQAACADDLKLLQRVESLLASHDAQSQFLDTPVVEQMAGESADDSGATVLLKDGSTQDAQAETAAFLSEESVPMSDMHDDQSDEIALGYLEPSTREGSLGRLGHYEILEVIGSGAFGTVLKAFDEKLHRVVAIKVLAPAMAATSPARKRFLREARSSAAVRHDNVVSIYAVEDEPIPFLVMEYIPGQTLQQRLAGTGPLDVPEVLRIGRQIADGLAAAHAQDLIHRDIKPGNILLDTSVNDHVKITDFGLARAADDASMTQSGMIAGTPLYMAPEQAQGQKLDQRADLFSFGSVLYQMLSGRPPFRAPSTVAVLKRVVEESPRPIQEIIPEVPDWICELISHLHAKNPDERYSSAREVSDVLTRCSLDVQEGRQPRIPAPVNAETVLRPALTRRTQTTKRQSSMKTLPRMAALVALLFVSLGLMEATSVTNLSSTVIRMLYGSGTLVIEIDDPSATVAINGEQVTIRGAGVEELTLSPGKHTVEAVKDGKIFDTELVSITRGGRTVIRTSLNGQGGTEPATGASPDDATRAQGPPLAKAPFDAKQAKQHQKAWADYLGVPVEYTNSIGMKFRLIPPGEFLMGSTPEEIEAASPVPGKRDEWSEFVASEGPQHRVILTRPLYLGTTEVTQEQYQQIIGDNPSLFSSEGKGKESEAVADLETRNFPVEHVSWYDAVAFCTKLSQREQLTVFDHQRGSRVRPMDATGYRLPTEAEWEFACRAGTGTQITGDKKSKTLLGTCWFAANADGRTHAVGELQANPLGLLDMQGNVWEWVQDSWDASFYGSFSEAPAIDPCRPIQSESLQVIRGGYWRDRPTFCRPSCRYANTPDHRYGIGFRVVLSVDVVIR
jgi:eukaryotic-like serine/threonine-protein kinase